MKCVPIPVVGARPISEFHYAGSLREEPSLECTDEQWADHLFLGQDPSRLSYELWFHKPSSRWYAAVRDVVEDRFIDVKRFTGRNFGLDGC